MNTIFKELATFLEEGCDINITVRKVADKMVACVSYNNTNVKDEAKRMIPPFTVSGTAEELDEEFVNVIKEPLQKSQGLQTSMKEFEAAMEVAKANTKAAAEAKKKENDAKKKEADAEKRKKEEYKKHLDAGNKLKNDKKWKEAIKEYQAALPYATDTEKANLTGLITLCKNNDTPDIFAVFDDEEENNTPTQEETTEEETQNTEALEDEKLLDTAEDTGEDDDDLPEDPGWGEENDFE